MQMTNVCVTHTECKESNLCFPLEKIEVKIEGLFFLIFFLQMEVLQLDLKDCMTACNFMQELYF